MSSQTIFEKIISGEIPHKKIYEDENYFAFLDIKPMHLGHTLLIPKTPIDYIFDLNEETYINLFKTATKIAPAIQKATNCLRVAMIVEGFGVPHAHLHLIPLTGPHQIDPRLNHVETEDNMEMIAEKIRSFL
ncbi:MAG: hypothetical protein RLY43_257 [Bacteroidota bacterium]